MLNSTPQTNASAITGGFIARARLLLQNLGAGSDAQSHAGRQAIGAFAIRVASAALAYLGQIFLARLLGQFEYGVFAYVWIWVIILGQISALGFGQSIIRFVPRYLEKSRPQHLQGYLRFAQGVVLLGSTFIALLAAAVLYLFAAQISNLYVWPLFLAVICIPLIAFADLQEGIARGFGWVNMALVPPYLMRPLLLIAGLALAIWLGAPVTAATAVGVAIGSTWLALVAQMLLLRRKIARQTQQAAQRAYKPRYWIKAALPLILVDSFYLLQTYADLLVLNLYVPPDQLAVYFATVKTVGLVSFIHYAVGAATQQRFSGLQAVGARQELATFVQTTTHWTFWPALLATFGILALGYPLLWLFGANFTTGYPLMFMLAAGILLHASMGQAEYLLNMLGHQNKVAMILFATLLINLGLNFALVPAFGLAGAAFATTLTLALQGALFSIVAYRAEGLKTWLLHDVLIKGKDVSAGDK